MDVRGKNVLITGASRGLGEALARDLAMRGARVVLTARGEGALERVAREIRAEGGVAHALPFDVEDKTAVYPTAGAAQALVGPIDVLVHNASTLGPLPMPLLFDTECEDLEAVLAVNLVGPFRLTKAIAGGMAVRKSGLVVFVSSDAAVNAYPGWGAYGVSKAALDHLARTWAAELEGSSVKTFSVDPGEMNTRMHADAMPDADPASLADPAHVARTLAAMIEGAESIASGARLVAASWSAS